MVVSYLRWTNLCEIQMNKTVAKNCFKDNAKYKMEQLVLWKLFVSLLVKFDFAFHL